MAWDEIKFKISADMDFSDALNQVNAIREGIGGLKSDIKNMPNATEILDTSLEKTASVATSLYQKILKLQNAEYKNESERLSIQRGAEQDISELNTMKRLQTGTGDFSVSLAQSWFGDLPKAVQKELDSVIPRVSSIIRTRMSSLTTRKGYKNLTQEGLVTEALADPTMQAIKNQLHNSVSKQQFRYLIRDLVPNVTPAHRLDAYQLKKYGSTISNEVSALSKGEIIDLFPKSFRESYLNKGYVRRNYSKNEGSLVLNRDSINTLNAMLEKEPIMAKAAIAAGISRRDARGVLETRKEISKQQWENYRAMLYDELVTRVAGYGKGKKDPYSTLPEDKKTLEDRFTQSTSGRTMLNMHDIERFEDKSAWTTGTGSNRYTKIRGEGRRATDQYVVMKYSPFIKSPDGKEFQKEVMISESHNTRLLGQGKWKNNDDVSSTIAVISLAGYDPNNKQHQETIYDLYKNGRVINGKKYIAQSTHGKGEDQVVRMIEESAYNRVNEQEGAWAKIRGLRGTYWGGFEDEEINRKIANGTITAKDWGKHLEMQNKAWTPSADVGLNLKNRRIAVVDYRGQGDGATWAPKSMMPDSGQIRFGIGGKGSVFVYDDEVLDSNGKVVKSGMAGFGAKTGIADAEGHVWMRGPDGNMFDVSGYDMIIPLDAIKNQGAYKDENGNFLSGERASEIATALGRRYGIGMLANYNKEDNASTHLGTQMMSFLNLNPAIREAQIKAGMKRMGELDTEAGQLKYIFGDETDWLSRQVNPAFGGNAQLLHTQQAQRRVDNHKRSLMQKIIGGEYEFMGEGDSGISDMRLAASPLAAYLMSHGGVSEDGIVSPQIIAKAREILAADARKRNVPVPQYTDKEISNMIVPGKDAEGNDTVLDFAHIGQKELAIIRSPTGYGNMVHAKNIAAEALPLYKAYGIDPRAGIYVSNDSLQTLQSADYDSDEAKVIYDDNLRKSVQETLQTQKYVKVKIDEKEADYTLEQLSDPAMQQMLRAGRAVVMNAGMGTGSSGIRIMQLDMSKPENQKYVQEAQRLAAYYDNRTVYDKNAAEMDIKDVNAWPTLKLGKEFTKFSDKTQDLFAFEDDLKKEGSDEGNENLSEVFRASNGLKVNLRRLKNMKVDEINLPAAFMANHLMGVSEIGQLYRAGLVETGQMDAIAEAMDHIGYGDAEGENGAARRKLMKTVRRLLPEFGSGARMMLMPAEARALSAMADNAITELETHVAKDYLDPATGKYMYNGHGYNDARKWAEAKGHEYGVRTAKNAVNLFGITEDRLQSLFGEDYSKIFKNSNVATIDLLPEDIEHEVLSVQKEQLMEEIHEARTVVDNEKKNKGKETKAQKKKINIEKQALDREIENYRKTLEIDENADIDDEIEKQEKLLEQRKAEIQEEHKDGVTSDGSAYDNTVISGMEDRLAGLKKLKSMKQNRINMNKSPAEQRLDELMTKSEAIDKQLEINQRAIDMRTEYQALLSDANEFADKMWGYQKGKENKILDSKSYAQKYWNRSLYQKIDAMAPLLMYEKKLEASDLPDSTKEEILNGITAVQNRIDTGVNKDFTNEAILNAKTLFEDIENDLNKQQNAPTRQKQNIDNYNKRIENAKSFVSFMSDKLYSGKIEAAYQKMYEDAIKEANGYIEKTENTKENLINEYTKQNEKEGKASLEELEIRHGVKKKNSAEVISARRKDEISTLQARITKEHDEGNYSDEEYEKISKDLDRLNKRANPAMIQLQQGMDAVKGKMRATTGYLMNMFSRQLFNSAISEVKRFVKEFNQTMTTIQMITLKTDAQMNELGSTIIDKAKDLKISVSDISKSAATLYRQGLSDQEVNERLDVISKFSKVSGAKVEDATKLVTVALNTGLVKSAKEASDIVTALGDNAATNAQQIEKGIEKAGAAAAADGTTFAELAAMLTAITSTTQIGGNVAGRTLNTIFGRMNKIGTNELIYDENGRYISGSAVARLLAAQGINMYDENGNKRSSYDTLYALSQKWDSLSDAEQQQFANAIAGTRQYSNFSAIMQGMSEGKVDEYLKLAEGSEGITDEKFEIYTKSLEASLTNLKNTFDELIADLTNSGFLTGVIDFISNIISGIDNITNKVGSLGAVLTSILPMFASMMVMSAGMRSGNWKLFGIGAGALATTAIVSSLFAKNTDIDYNQRYQDSINYIDETYASRKSKIEEAQALYNKTDRTEEESKKLGSIVHELATAFNLEDPTSSMQTFKNAINDSSQAAQSASKSIKDYAKTIKDAEDRNEESRIAQITSKLHSEWALGQASSYKDFEYDTWFDRSLIGSLATLPYGQVDSNGSYTLVDRDRFKSLIAAEDYHKLDAVPGTFSGAMLSLGNAAFMDSGIFSLLAKNLGLKGSTEVQESTYVAQRDALSRLVRTAISTPGVLSDSLSARINNVFPDIQNWDNSDWINIFDSMHHGNWGKEENLIYDILEEAFPTLSPEKGAYTKHKDYITNVFSDVFSEIMPSIDKEQLSKGANRASEMFSDLVYNGMQYENAFSNIVSTAFDLNSKNYSPTALSSAWYRFLMSDNTEETRRLLQDYKYGLDSSASYYMDQNGQTYDHDSAIRLLQNQDVELANATIEYLSSGINRSKSGMYAIVNKDDQNDIKGYYNSYDDAYTSWIESVRSENQDALLTELFSKKDVQTNELNDELYEEARKLALLAKKTELTNEYVAKYNEDKRNGDVLAITADMFSFAHENHGDENATLLQQFAANLGLRLTYNDFLQFAQRGELNPFNPEQLKPEYVQEYFDDAARRKITSKDIENQISTAKSNIGYDERLNEIDSQYKDYFENILTKNFSIINENIIVPIEDYVKNLLGDVDVESIANTFNIFPETIQSILDGTFEIGNDAIQSLVQTANEIKHLRQNSLKLRSVKDYFTSGATGTVQDWENENQYGLTADWALRTIAPFKNLPSTKENIQALYDLINLGGEERWKILNSDYDVASVISKVITENGIIKNAPEDFFVNLYNALATKSVSYGGTAQSNYARLDSARRALTGLTSSSELTPQVFVTPEESREAFNKYLQEESFAVRYFDTIQQAGVLPGSDQYIQAARAAYEASSPLEYDEWMTKNGYGILDSLDSEYLDTALGSALSSKIKAHQASPEEINMAYRMLQNQAYGGDKFTELEQQQGLADIYSHLQAGTFTSYLSSDDINKYGLYTSGLENAAQLSAMQLAIESSGVKIGNRSAGIFDLLNPESLNSDQYKEISKALEDAGYNFELAKKVAKDFNNELLSKGIKATNKYGDATEEVAQNMTAIAKGGKQASQAIGQLRQQMAQMNNAAEAIKAARGKSGAQLNANQRNDLAAVTGEDAELIKSMSKEQIEELTQRAQSIIDEDFMNSIGGTISEMLTKHFAENPAAFDMAVKADVNKDGAIDLSELATVAAQLDDQALAVLAQYAGQIGELLLRIKEGDGSVAAYVELIKGKVNGSGKRQGGGGGGGGKSKVDKLLEEQKHKLAELQHEQKMLEIKEKDYDYSNDFDASRRNYDDQIEVQRRLAAQYRENIAEVQNLMKTIKEGTDDWWKAKEAINSYEESLASINSTINEINSKNIKLLEDQQKIADTPGSHMQSMLEKLASRAMTEDRFADFERLTTERIAEINAQKDLNDVQIKEWESQLKNYEENSDSWLEVRDKIWALEEENADLENQALQQTLELNQQRLSQIGKALQENTQTATHNQNIASTYGDYYQNGGYRTDYENMIRVQQQATSALISENMAAEQSALAQMSTLQENTTAWFEAQAAVYSYQEAIAQAEVTQAQLNRTLAESNIEAVNEQYTDATRELVHVNDLLKNQAQEYLDTNDYEAYFEAMERYLDNLPTLIGEATTKLNGLQAIYDEGMSNDTLDLTMQRQLLDQINDAESERQSLILQQRQAQREVNKANLDIMFEGQNWGESNYEHNLKLVSYEASRYQNAGELTNYGNMISAETRLRKDRLEVLKEELAELEAQHENFKDGSDEEQRIVEAIKKHEEAISSENTQIEKNNKLLEENQKKIMQVQKTLENAVDKEIEDNKRRQREILAANVSMNDTLVNLLKKRLQDEWALRKKDLDKEKETLNEYKKLINERFNYRKKAAQQADKDEELADYRRQLALIEADPTRTREAKELRRKIEDLEKDQAWAIAEDEVNAEGERIDQNIEGIDKFISYNEELLNEILSDANNFAVELNEIINGSFEESYEKIIAFMQAENEAFMKSLPQAQQQMIQGWEDTWKKANDILDNNYKEISEILYDENGGIRSEEDVVNWFKENDRMYRDYIENGDMLNAALAERGWQESYRNVVSALKNTAEFTPDDHTLGDVVSKLDELADGIFKVNIVDVNGSAIGPYGLDGASGRYTDFSNGEGYSLTDYAGIGYVAPPAEATPSKPASSGSGTASSGLKKYVVGGYGASDNPHGMTSGIVWASSTEEAKEKFKKAHPGITVTTVYLDDKVQYSANTGSTASTSSTQTIQSKSTKPLLNNNDKDKSMFVYASGGLVDYTGTAWVDGTRMRPESFLDATDTALLREQLDAFKYVKNTPYMSYVDPSMYGNNTTVGDVNITINQAEINSDADINKLAKQVGKAFTRELKINGVNVAGYAFA